MRVDLAACYRLVDHYGMDDMFATHISARVPGSHDHFLVNPYGLLFSQVTASNLVKVDLDGSIVQDTEHVINPAGFVIHSAIHGSLKDAHCVMHTHTTNGVAVSCLEEGLSHHNFYGAMLHGKVAYHEFEGITVEPGEKERLVRDLGDKPVMLLRNHGLLAWGASVPEAFMWLWTVQRACDVQITASKAGAVRRIRDEVFPQTVREGGPAEKRTCEDVFAALQRKVERIDPSYRN
jgi:ribulose-5-phosphate 4-epimerase/fuculose-1-phosphate aldolase